MGDATATVDGQPIVWPTCDFPVGAHDASAWITDDDDTGVVTLRIMAFAPGQPDKTEDRPRINAVFSALPKTGDPPQTVLVEVPGEADINDRKMTSGSTPAMFGLDGFSRDSSACGRAAGRFGATICLQRNESASVTCQCGQLRGTFDIGIQLNNMGASGRA